MPNAPASASASSESASPTGVRLPPELKLDLQRAAVASNRTLSQEIVLRLRASFQNSVSSDSARIRNEPYAMTSGGVDTVVGEPGSPVYRMNPSESLMLSLFNSLSPEKQLALLTFLKKA